MISRIAIWFAVFSLIGTALVFMSGYTMTEQDITQGLTLAGMLAIVTSFIDW